ncbi:MAG: CDP-diacylglycerol--glycerol-3-phosphate 3-phosphatidyltransferase [Candidatus Omnitrophica bacterium CG07_land_8_20_14_0_80_50_8]|nr:MAG: CDP-diacylglycerol--glycerol-3-phosphate 3-phosphatidyltransferase [Candidatus Omnitrophica bacterium CG07_land_8_20_14_0_80_50_8]
MNLPNILTCSRIGMTGIFMFLLSLKGVWPKSLALFVFLLASLTDYWDGRLARKTNQITSFGKLMDPIADKILTLSAFLAFVQMTIIPAWMAVAIITRDLLITGLRFLMPERGASRQARSSGKHKTSLQFAAIVGVLIFLTIKETSYWRPEWTPGALSFIYWSMFLIVVITLWSGVRYAVKNREIFNG